MCALVGLRINSPYISLVALTLPFHYEFLDCFVIVVVGGSLGEHEDVFVGTGASVSY